MSDLIHRDIILQTIDKLRKRKTRPNLSRICHNIQRIYGIAQKDIIVEIDKLVDQKLVLKVEYKGSVSFRNAAKYNKSATCLLSPESSNNPIMEKEKPSSLDDSIKSDETSNSSNLTDSSIEKAKGDESLNDGVDTSEPGTSPMKRQASLDEEAMSEKKRLKPGPKPKAKCLGGVHNDATAKESSSKLASPGKRGRPLTKRKVSSCMMYLTVYSIGCCRSLLTNTDTDAVMPRTAQEALLYEWNYEMCSTQSFIQIYRVFPIIGQVYRFWLLYYISITAHSKVTWP